jgi:hypothetical protein
MPQYLISFDNGTMKIPAEELAEVARAGMAVIHEAEDAGVFLFSGGFTGEEPVSVVAVDGTVVTDGPYPESKEFVGGFTVVEVATREEALRWAAKIAAVCRCPQDVREFPPQPKL